MDNSDREWFHALHAGARGHGAAVRLICLATPAGTRQLTLDDAGEPWIARHSSYRGTEQT